MTYVSNLTGEIIPTSVQMTYVSKITCESIPTSVHMIYVRKLAKLPVIYVSIPYQPVYR